MHKKAKKMDSKQINFEIHDHKLFINNNEIVFPNYKIINFIGRGANGIVLHGQNVYLSRDVAIKIWATLKNHDKRDKFRQGIEEAKKALKIESPNTIRLYDAGEILSYFYAIYELVDGITCSKWMEIYQPNLLTRVDLAQSVTHEIFNYVIKKIIHGDLHTGNILIEKPYKDNDYIFRPKFKIIDFGTSYFSENCFSEKRHWKIFNRTINEIIYPLNVNRLWGHKYPKNEPVFYLLKWYFDFFDEVPTMLESFGYHLPKGQYETFIYEKDLIHDPNYTDTKVNEGLKILLHSNKLLLDPKNIGIILNNG